MATRIQDLEESAQPMAKFLVQRSGSLKRVLSAGVLVLGQMDSAERERYMAAAAGAETIDQAPVPLRKEMDRLLEELRQLVRQNKQPSQKARRAKLG